MAGLVGRLVQVDDRERPRRRARIRRLVRLVEHRSDGQVVRGRLASTTNVRMELLAATRGLQATPRGAEVVLHTDCTTILCVRDRLADGRLARFAGPDQRFWRDLADELASRDVTVDLLLKGPRDPRHQRADGIAGSEARAGLGIPDPTREARQEERRRRRKVARLAVGRFDAGGPWDCSAELAGA